MPSPRIGLALAGGGPLGAIYEIGALCALEEALGGLDFTQLAGYVGVSAGGFIAAGLANGLTPRRLCRGFIENDGGTDDLVPPAIFVHPAWGEFGARLAALPWRAAQVAWRVARGAATPLEAAERLAGALPTGLFRTAPIEAHLKRVFSLPGRSDDFRTLGRPLVLVATDLDAGTAAPFGLPGWDSVPISRAVTASAALPGLYPPVAIGGRHYVDGALKKTLHARVLLDQGMDLLLCLNPLVPFDAAHALAPDAVETGALGPAPALPPLVQGGLPLVLSQTFRSLIHSRLEQGLRGYETSHPQVDIALFEPDRRDPALFGANTFSYAARRRLAEHAYQATRADLRRRRRALEKMFARHGVRLDAAVLDDPARRLVPQLALASPPPATARPGALGASLARLGAVLDTLEATLQPR